MYKTIEGVQIFSSEIEPDAGEQFDEWRQENEHDISMMYLSIKSKRDIRIHQASCVRFVAAADGNNASDPKICAQGQGRLREFVALNELSEAKRCPSCKAYW